MSASNQRRNALGLGVTPGEANAFEINYGRLIDPNTFLTGVNTALHDVTKRVGLYGAGMTEDELKSKDTAQVSSELLQHLKKIADETPEAMMQNVLTARHLDQFINLQDFERLKNTPAAEIGQYQQSFQRDTRDLELTNAQTRAWQDLQVQLHRAGAVLENTLIRGLTALAAPIGRLSAAFTELVQQVLSSKQVGQWIDELAVGIKWLGDYIGSPQFHAGVTWLIEGIDDLGHRFVAFVKQVDDMLPSWADVKKFSEEFGEDLKVAGEALKEFVHVVDDMAKALADAMHTVVDPFTKGTPLNNDSGQFSGQIERWNRDYPDNQIPTEGLPDDQGDATGWDRLKNWWNGGNFSGKLMHQSSYEEPRGIRNNNPLNLSYAPGQGAMGSDGRFGVYDTPEAGIAASERQLQRYQDRYGLDTIAQIINKWAPPGENDTGSYIAQVSRETGFAPDQHLDLHDKATIQALITAMAHRETGRRLDAETVARGVDQGADTQRAGVKFVPNQGRPSSVAINVNNATGGNSYISASQLAVG